MEGHDWPPQMIDWCESHDLRNDEIPFPDFREEDVREALVLLPFYAATILDQTQLAKQIWRHVAWDEHQNFVVLVLLPSSRWHQPQCRCPYQGCHC